jgi:hypothetical protein
MTRMFRPLVLGLALLFGSVAPGAAFAQNGPDPTKGFFDIPDNGEPKEEGWGPVPGYLVTGLFSALAIFILCKSARR